MILYQKYIILNAEYLINIMKRLVPFFSLMLLIFSAKPSHAHVGYVIGEDAFNSRSGLDWTFLFSVFTNPLYILLMLTTLVLTVGGYLLLYKNKHIVVITSKITKKAESYSEYVPLILRLSLGTALIGAGSMNEMVSPLLHASSFLATLQVILGFLMIFGLFTPALIIFTIMLYGFAVSQNIYLVGNIDLLFAGITLLLLANFRPSLDDLFSLPVHRVSKKTLEYVPLLLRLGIGIAMTFLAVYEKILNPHSSAFVVQKYHLGSAIPVSDAMWVFSTGAIEVVVGLMLILGFKTRLVSTVALLVLSSSFFFFKEGVAAHVTLFAILVCIFILGPGGNSLDNYFSKKKS